MLWLLLVILAYFLLAVSALFDRYFLAGPIQNPKAYTFYVGILGFCVCPILLFFGVDFSSSWPVFLGILTGLARILAIFFLAKGLTMAEVSRVSPAISGFMPVFSFLLFFFFFPGYDSFSLVQGIAFILLVFGSIFISLKEFSFKFFSFQILKYPVFSAFLFALNFLLSKKLFLQTDFVTGFFFMLIGAGLGAVFLLFFQDARKNIFQKTPGQKISLLLILSQGMGGIAVLLQYLAVYLANPNQVPLVNALEGTKGVFLLLFVFLLSGKNPNLLKEEMSEKLFLQKISAILLIVAGFLMLYLG